MAAALRMTPAGFRVAHPADRWWFATLLAVLVLGLLAGFIPEMLHPPADPALHLPIMHLHAALFAGWMVLVAVQLLLVRVGHTAWHRRLGRVAFAWMPAMVAIGVATAIQSHRSRWGTPFWDPGFLSIQLSLMVLFGVLGWMAMQHRGDPAAHKRLVLLATLSLSPAGWGRLLGDTIAGLIGTGFAGAWVIDFAVVTVLLIGFLAFDMVTRGRPHPAVVRGSVLISSLGLLACWAYPQPWWRSLSAQLLGH